MRDKVSRAQVFLDARHWKSWLAVGTIGLVATLGVGALAGIGPLDVLLLKNDAIAPFTIVDYTLFGYGLVQVSRVWFRQRANGATRA